MRKHPNHQELVQLAGLNKQFPGVLKYLEDWYQVELSALPMVLDRTAVAQGRCQVLQELIKLVNQAPDIAAKPPAAVNIAHH